MALSLKLTEIRLDRWKNILPKYFGVLMTVVEIAVEQIGP